MLFTPDYAATSYGRTVPPFTLFHAIDITLIFSLLLMMPPRAAAAYARLLDAAIFLIIAMPSF